MSITSVKFLLWLAVVVAGWYLTPCRLRWMVALLASVWFYAALGVRGLPVMLCTALLVWWCSVQIQKLHDDEAAWLAENKDLPREDRRAAKAGFDARKKRFVALALFVDIGMLFLVKYYPPLASGAAAVTGIDFWRAENLFIPLGISYYSLQLAGYLIDVYRTVIPAEKNPLRVVTFAAFFLSVTQGPFSRFGTLMPQMDAEHEFSRRRVFRGMQRMAWGYFQKLAVADRAAIIANKAFVEPSACTGAQLAFAMAAFGVQLYADFSGYTNIVLGAGEMLGLTLPDNFRQPFFSRNMPEFWQRWHITLGAWLKDYVFYPVLKSALFTSFGAFLKPRIGKKAARQLPTWLGMLILWFTIGLWHGAGFNYVFGVGLLQFLYIFLGEVSAPLLSRMNAFLRVEKWPHLFRVWQGLRCTLLMIVAWVFFRAESFSQAVEFLRRMVGGFRLRDVSLGAFTAMGVNRMGLLMLFYGVLVLLVVDLLHEKGVALRDSLAKSSLPLKLGVYQLALWSMVLLGIFMSGGTGTFLYAHF